MPKGVGYGSKKMTGRNKMAADKKNIRKAKKTAEKIKKSGIAKAAGKAAGKVAKKQAMKTYAKQKMGGGVGMLTKRIKAMDPSSAVTEGEYRAAMRALGRNKKKNADMLRRGK
jgi:hypothetical protein